jgi:hypothetical protein
MMLSILPNAAEFRQSNSEMEEKFLGIYNFVAVAKTRCSGKPWAAVAGMIATQFTELLSGGLEIFDVLPLVA